MNQADVNGFLNLEYPPLPGASELEVERYELKQELRAVSDRITLSEKEAVMLVEWLNALENNQRI